jgi:hypothetical protein
MVGERGGAGSHTTNKAGRAGLDSNTVIVLARVAWRIPTQPISMSKETVLHDTILNETSSVNSQLTDERDDAGQRTFDCKICTYLKVFDGHSLHFPTLRPP